MRVSADTEVYHVEVKEDGEGLGIIIDIFHNDEIVGTHTYWNDDAE